VTLLHGGLDTTRQVTSKEKHSVTHTSAKISVADPDPNPDPDPHVFGPPGSGSGFFGQRYGSGSGSESFYHQAKP
jgi:hypothetical protein